MQNITLQALLEAGSHFGHKSERWHPKASQFIYTEKDGIHIIDLAKTKSGLEAAVKYIQDTITNGGEVLFVGTKRQARGVLQEEAKAAGAPYFVIRWIGGFLTNWESIKKNVDKANSLAAEQAAGDWKKFPKHEQSLLSRHLTKLNSYYDGVLKMGTPPTALFIIDVKKEIAAVREGQRMGMKIIAVVDTNSDPTGIDYVIPANDDAVGSIQYITHVVTSAYKEAKEQRNKEDAKAEVTRLKKAEADAAKAAADKESADKAANSVSLISHEVQANPSSVPEVSSVPTTAKPAATKRGRPKKVAVEDTSTKSQASSTKQ